MSLQKKNKRRQTLSCILSLSLVTISVIVKKDDHEISGVKRLGIKLHSSRPSSSSSPSAGSCNA